MIPANFLNRITIGNGCWEWVGNRYSNGYGKYYDRKVDGGPGRHVLAHRFIYSLLVGEIAGVINHLCENKACVRPDHLEDVTQQQNVQYSLSDTCSRGHDITRGNPNVYVDPKNNKRKCRACMSENKKIAYWSLGQSYRDELATRSARHYSQNRDAVLAQKRDYYIRNREAILARRRERRLLRINSQEEQ